MKYWTLSIYAHMPTCGCLDPLPAGRSVVSLPLAFKLRCVIVIRFFPFHPLRLAPFCCAWVQKTRSVFRGAGSFVIGRSVEVCSTGCASKIQKRTANNLLWIVYGKKLFFLGENVQRFFGFYQNIMPNGTKSSLKWYKQKLSFWSYMKFILLMLWPCSDHFFIGCTKPENKS